MRARQSKQAPLARADTGRGGPAACPAPRCTTGRRAFRCSCRRATSGLRLSAGRLAAPIRPARRFDLGRAMTRLSLRNFVAVARDRRRDGRLAGDRPRDRAAEHSSAADLARGPAPAAREAFRIACRHPEAFAGVVSLGGPFPLDEAAVRTDRRRAPAARCSTAAPAGRGRGDAAHTDRTLRLFHAAGAMLAMRIYPARRSFAGRARPTSTAGSWMRSAARCRAAGAVAG